MYTSFVFIYQIVLSNSHALKQLLNKITCDVSGDYWHKRQHFMCV